MASALGAAPGEIVFTAGGTESDNLAVFGTLEARGGRAVCTAVEHHAILEPVESSGGQVVPVLPTGQIDLDALAEALTPDVSIVSVMLANNETGIVQPLAQVAELVRSQAPNALLHTDAVQAFSWLDVASIGRVADLVSVSAHKFGGPQGVGALVMRAGANVAPRLRGGGQERGRRSGTQNVAGIAGMAVAATETVRDRPAEILRISALRDRLADGIRESIPGVVESGVPSEWSTDEVARPGRGNQPDRRNKTANVCHVCFEGLESEALLFLLERNDVLASAAASCSSGAQEPSHVLAAMGYDRQLAFGSLRLSLGHTSTAADVDAVLNVLPEAVERLRTAELGAGMSDISAAVAVRGSVGG